MKNVFDHPSIANARGEEPARKKIITGLKIQICKENSAALMAVLLGINGAIEAHTFSAMDQIQAAAAAAEQCLDSIGLPKSRRKGVEVLAQSGGGRMSTTKQTNTICILRGKKNWFLKEVRRTKLLAGEEPMFVVWMSDAQIELAHRACGEYWQKIAGRNDFTLLDISLLYPA